MDVPARHLSECGMEIFTHHSVPDHKQAAWRADYANIQSSILGCSASAMISLLCHSMLNDQEIEYVITSRERFDA